MRCFHCFSCAGVLRLHSNFIKGWTRSRLNDPQPCDIVPNGITPAQTDAHRIFMGEPIEIGVYIKSCRVVRAGMAAPLTSLRPRPGSEACTREDIRLAAEFLLYVQGTKELYGAKAYTMQWIKTGNMMCEYLWLMLGYCDPRYRALRGGQPCARRWTMHTMAVGASVLVMSGKTYSTSCNEVQHTNEELSKWIERPIQLINEALQYWYLCVCEWMQEGSLWPKIWIMRIRA